MPFPEMEKIAIRRFERELKIQVFYLLNLAMSMSHPNTFGSQVSKDMEVWSLQIRVYVYLCATSLAIIYCLSQ